MATNYLQLFHEFINQLRNIFESLPIMLLPSVQCSKMRVKGEVYIAFY
jgi:hypothetical protein